MKSSQLALSYRGSMCVFYPEDDDPVDCTPKIFPPFHPQDYSILHHSQEHSICHTRSLPSALKASLFQLSIVAYIHIMDLPVCH